MYGVLRSGIINNVIIAYDVDMRNGGQDVIMALNPEQIDHINVVNWFHFEFPELADDFHHFANERKCTIMEGRKLKRMGVKKGVTDFFLALPQNGKFGIWIELKVGKNTLSKEQIAFMERKISRGYDAIAVWGFEACKAVILTYLKDYLQHRECRNERAKL